MPTRSHDWSSVVATGIGLTISALVWIAVRTQAAGEPVTAGHEGVWLALIGGAVLSVAVAAYVGLSRRNTYRLQAANRQLDQALGTLNSLNEQLRAQNMRFDTALNNMTQGLCFFDGDQRLIVSNSRYVEMYGLPAHRVQAGTTLREIVDLRFEAGSFPTMSREEYLVWRTNVAVSDQPSDTVVELMTGQTFLIRHRPMPGGGWVATHEDITEQRKAEKALAAAREFLNTIIDTVPVSIMVKDVEDLRYVLINRAAEKFIGLPRGDILGKSPHDILPKEAADIMIARDRELLATGGPQVFFGERPLHAPIDGPIINSKKIIVRDTDGRPQYLLGVIEDVTEQKQAEAQIAHMAHHDVLTNLPNRAAFNERLRSWLETATAAGESFAVLCIDLDRFKEVNDVFGHAVGDQLLCEVTSRLQAVAGEEFLARLGGDEFTFIAAHGSPAMTEALAERLLASVADEFEIEGHALRASLSIGVAVFPTDGADATTLLGNADAALYRAKAEGRGTVRFFDAGMDKLLREHRSLQHDLRSALERNEFALQYQPQALMNGEVIGFEALVRWHHPIRGVVSPATFIPIAEETGLIIPLGEWILREACREAASWPRPLQIAVNFSPIQFQHGDLPGFVHTILLETGVAASRLELEITEGVLIGDFSRAVSILRRLKTLGVRISMDDFGTGYSSLSYLQSFPFDKIKIDRAFISNLDSNAQSVAIVRAVIGLGRGLNLPVIAEGVETQGQLDILSRESCDEIQGYLIGRPLPIAQYAKVVGRIEETRAPALARAN